MTIEEIKELGIEELETRAAQIAEETRTADAETIEKLNAELDAIEERKKVVLDEIENRKKDAEAVINGNGVPVKEKEVRTMTDKEIRSTKKYIDAYVDYIKGKNDGSECRALLTENAGEVEGASGPVPVPTYLEDRIQTAWENDEIMSRVSKTFLKGNVKVGVEMAATGATWHTEGGEAPTEEELTLAVVNLIPETVKKWITASTEVMDLNGEAFLDYLYDEITYQIVKATAIKALALVANAPTSGTAAPTVANMTVATPALGDFIQAIGLLSSSARDIAVIASNSTIAQYKALALAANYAADIFDGATVIRAEMPNGVTAIVGDLAAIRANYPNGDEVKFVFDEYSLAEQDMVKIVGRQYVGMGLIRDKAFTVIRPGA